MPESISLQIDANVADKLMRYKREGSKLNLNLEGRIMPVQIKEVSFAPLTNQILHIAFQILSEHEKVNSVIHILLANDEKISGILEKLLLEIPYASLPENMIDTITVDLDGMPAGKVLAVKDIPEFMSGKIELQVDPESIVLRIVEKKHQGANQSNE